MNANRLVAIALLLCLALVSTPWPVLAAEEQENGGDPEKWGLSLELGFHTLYMFRGYNLFQEKSNRDPHMALTPAVTWSVLDTGLAITIFGAYQLNGNVSQNIDIGLGAEQDLVISYERALTEDLTFSAAFIWYLYPFADPELAGGTLPSYLEPILGLTWSGPVDAGLELAYSAGVQDALADFRYLYISPHITKEFPLWDLVKIQTSFSFGMKLFSQGELLRDNSYDLLLSAAAPLSLGSSTIIKPSVNLAWTNTADLNMDQELLFWFGLSAGCDL